MHLLPLRQRWFERPVPAPLYRPDIDGLRALAVLCVIIYHAVPALLPGGFIGVDVFFVISGFLISRLLFAGLDRGRLDLAEFYARRVRRIFPALLVLLPLTLAYGFVVLLPSELAELGKNVAASAGFVANLTLFTESGYFDKAAAAKPLLHLWSLGVEEQFYLVWPALLWLLARARRARAALVTAAALLSFAAHLALLHRDPDAAFYWPASRLWELAAGALLAASPAEPPGSARARDLLSVAGLTLILLSAALLSGASPAPGWAALAPVGGAVLLLAAGPATRVNRRLLSHHGAVFLGRISYPLYLWHWPPLAFATIIRLGRPPTPLMATLLVAASAVAAWLTMRFVERPIRWGPHPRRTAIVLTALMALELAAGLAVWQADGFPDRLTTTPALDVATINRAAAAPVFAPTPNMRVVNHAETEVARIGHGPDLVMFLGDSLIFHYGPRVQALFEQGRLAGTVTFVVGASCAPVPDIHKTGRFAHCTDLPAIADAELAAHPARTVVIGAAWPGYAVDIVEVERHGRRDRGDTEAGITAFYANLEDAVAALTRSGHQVYLVLSSPVSEHFAPSHMIARSPIGFAIDPNAAAAVPIGPLRAASAVADAHLRAIAAATGAHLLDPYPNICGDGPTCSPVDATEPKFADIEHLRARFVRAHATLFDPILTRRANDESATPPNTRR